MMYILDCILYSVYCLFYIAYCILYVVYCILYILFCILYILYFIFYILYSMFYIPYYIFCILYHQDRFRMHEILKLVFIKKTVMPSTQSGDHTHNKIEVMLKFLIEKISRIWLGKVGGPGFMLHLLSLLNQNLVIDTVRCAHQLEYVTSCLMMN